MSDLRLPLAQRITSRDGTLDKDSYMANMFREESEGKVEAVKRPGYSLQATFVSDTGQGMFSMVTGNYAVVNDTIYDIDFGTSDVIPATTISDLPYDFITNVTFGLLTITIVKSTTGLWYFDGTTVTKVVDPDYPASTVRGIVLLDGTCYVMDLEGTIYGSAIDDLTSWSALNFIGVDQSLGRGVRLVRHLNYCFAFNDLGLQAFYDAANAAPGSPLLPAGNATYLIGCAHAGSVVAIDDMVIFMSKGKQRGRSISALQGLSLITISTPFVDKILNRSTLDNVISFGLKVSGHSFYVLTFPSLNITLVCDLVAHDWAVWTSGADESYFAMGFYLNTSTRDYLQHITTGSVYQMSPLLYQDAGVAITCRVRTTPYDGQTTINKFFTALNLIGSQVASTVSVRYSDTDYQSYSAYRQVDMNSDRKQLRGLGRSRRRVFDVKHIADTPLRLEGMEFELYLGDS